MENREKDYQTQGLALHKQNDLKGAVECYNKVIQINPKIDMVYYYKGIALKALNDLKGAVECYNKFIEINPKYFDVYYNKGNALIDLNDPKGAVECFNKAIDINPEYQNTYYNKGIALKALNDLKGAVECYNKAIEIDPKDDMAYYNKGNALQALKSLNGAVECYNNAIEINPKLDIAYQNKGKALESLNDLKGALESYNKAIEINPKQILAYTSRAKIHQLQDNIQLAFNDFKQAQSLLDNGGMFEELSAGNVIYIKNALKDLAVLEELMGKIDYQLLKIKGTASQKTAIETNIAKLNKLIQAISVKNTADKISNTQNLEKVKNDPLATAQIQQNQQLLEVQNQNLKQYVEKLVKESVVFKNFDEANKTLLEKIAILEDKADKSEIRANKNEIRLDKVETDINDAGIAEKAEVNRELKKIEEGEPELYNYFKTFYWTSVNMILAYRNLSTGLMQGNYKSNVGEYLDDNKDSIVSGIQKGVEYASGFNAVKTGVKVATSLLKAVPFVGSIVSSIDAIVNMICAAKDKIDQNAFQNKINAINKVVQNKFGTEDQISIKLARVAIELTKIKEIQILYPETVAKSKLAATVGWFEKRINSIKERVLPSVQLHDQDSNGVTIALKDVTLFIAYICKNSDKIIKMKKSVHEQIVDIVKADGLSYMVTEVNFQVTSEASDRNTKTQQNNGRKGCTSLCSIFSAIDLKYDDESVNALMNGKISLDLFNLFLDLKGRDSSIQNLDY